MIEVIGGFIPVFPFAIEISCRMHNHASKGDAHTAAILLLAQGIQLTDGTSLRITEGMMSFRAAYDRVLHDGHGIDPTPIYRAVMAAVAREVDANYVVHERDWQAETSGFTRKAGLRLQEVGASGVVITKNELSGLIEWLDWFGHEVIKGGTNHDELRAWAGDMAVGKGDGRSNATRLDRRAFPTAEVARGNIREFQRSALATHATHIAAGATDPALAIPGLFGAQWRFRKRSPSMSC